MKERPILFSAPMVRAILDGSKTQTRRVIKPQPYQSEYEPDHFSWMERTKKQQVYTGKSGKKVIPKGTIISTAVHRDWFKDNCPYGQPGDRLCPAMPIPSLNRNYCADVYGRIWSRARDGETWEMLKGSPTSKGYLSVTPAHEGKYKTKLVHRLVAEAFYGYEPDGLKQVRHLNGDQGDNSPENLDWGSQEDNWSDRYAHSRHKDGYFHHSAKLTQSQANEIEDSHESQRKLARKYAVAQSTIWAIKKGLFWHDSPKPNPVNMPRWASRITLEITGVRVERLQDITNNDALDEGTPDLRTIENGWDMRRCFQDLWEQINGVGSWGENPWVWVIEFKKV